MKIGRVFALIASTALLALITTGCPDKTITAPEGVQTPATNTPSPSSSSSTGSSKTPTPTPTMPPGLTSPPNPNVTGETQAKLSPSKKHPNSGASPAPEINADLDFAFVVGYSGYAGPGEPVNLEFQDGEGNTLLIGGTAPQSKKPTKTSPKLGLVMTLTGLTPEPLQFTSGDGSCKLEFSKLKTRSIAGKFQCPALMAPHGVAVKAVGTFSAKSLA